jgi:hypothetical protein
MIAQRWIENPTNKRRDHERENRNQVLTEERRPTGRHL